MMSKLQVGAAGYDIVVPTGYIVTVLAAQNLLPLRKQYLTNFEERRAALREPGVRRRQQVRHAVAVGHHGHRLPQRQGQPAARLLGCVPRRKYKGKMTQMDDLRDAIGAWLKYRGKSLNSTDKAELDQVKKDAIGSKALPEGLRLGAGEGSARRGDVWIAQLWNGDTAQAKVEEAKIEYVLPKEGGGIWTDSLVIPASAPHKRAAHEFMNFILRPEIAASISDFTGYGTPVEPGLALMKNPVPYPTAEEQKRLEYQKDLGQAAQAWDQLWTEIKSA
jgi:spermidine/putrescine transport system substrate-binding protein